MGSSEMKRDILGLDYIQHYDDSGAPSGQSVPGKDFLGFDQTTDYDSRGNYAGYSMPDRGLLGDNVNHYDREGRYSGYSPQADHWPGRNGPDTTDSHSASSSPSTSSDSSPSSDSSTSGDAGYSGGGYSGGGYSGGGYSSKVSNAGAVVGLLFLAGLLSLAGYCCFSVYNTYKAYVAKDQVEKQWFVHQEPRNLWRQLKSQGYPFKEHTRNYKYVDTSVWSLSGPEVRAAFLCRSQVISFRSPDLGKSWVEMPFSKQHEEDLKTLHIPGYGDLGELMRSHRLRPW
jgi:hypothetical protein